MAEGGDDPSQKKRSGRQAAGPLGRQLHAVRPSGRHAANFTPPDRWAARLPTSRRQAAGPPGTNFTPPGRWASRPPTSHILQGSQNSVSVTNTSEEVPGKRGKFSKLGVFQEPLCLIKNEADGSFSIEEDVLNQISQIDRTVNVIAIAGPYRSGKSYLMNRLARNKHGFSLGNKVDAKTKGIWVWCLIHPVYSDQVMILLDTEGIGDAKKSNSDNDNKLLCITTLICSTFIYNIKGVINMETLDKLGFVTYCARKVSVSGDKQQNAYSSNIGLYFPSFVLCLRDFSHDLDKETPNAYLERMLTLKNDDEKESYNQIRACIRNFFQKRECFIFDTPVSGRKNLAKLESSDEKDLLESFKEDSHKFIESITKNKPKELLDGKNMNGSMFSSLVKAYVNMFNVDGIPCIDSALTTMATHENMIVVKNVAESFRIELNKNKLPVYNEKKLQELYQRARERVNKEFRLKCVLIIEKPVDDELKKHIDEIWKEYNDKNIRTQKEGCVSAMENMYGSEIKKKMNEGIYGDEGGYSKYAEDLDHIKSQTRQNFRDMDDTLFKECFSEFRDDHRDDMIMMTISEQSRKKLKDQHDTEMRQFQEQFEKKFQAEKEKYRALDVEHEKQRSIDEANYKRKIEEAVKKWETDKSELLEKLQKEEKRVKCLLSMLKIELDANEPTIMKIIARGTSSLLPVIGPVIFDAYRKKKHKERREKYRKQINEMFDESDSE